MNRSLGQIMITENLLTPEQVEEAVTFKNENRCHFGAACIELGFLSERQVMEVLGIQLYMPVIRMSNFNIDSEALEFIPKDRARRLKVIPLFVIEDTLTVATAEPLNITAVDEIRKMTNKRIQMVLQRRKILNWPLIEAMYLHLDTAMKLVMEMKLLWKKRFQMKKIFKLQIISC